MSLLDQLPRARPYAIGRGAEPIAPLTSAGRIFLAGGQPWRYKGVSAFPLARHFTDGVDIDPFLAAFAGFNTLRCFDYVTWPQTGWESCTADEWLAFLRYVGALGWYVEATLLTDDDMSRIAPARRLVDALADAAPVNFLSEIGNEPRTHKHIDVDALRAACEASGFLYASGGYEAGAPIFGRYGVAHTERADDWPRRAHDLMEYYEGGGPHAKTDPAYKMPWVADEPIRPDQAAHNAQDYRAYFGACALFGAGGTFHFEGGKYGRVPTLDEARCAAAALEGLDAFPPAAPLGLYRRIDEEEGRGDEGSLRTFVVGDSMVCVRPDHPSAPEPGWTSRDPDGILWTRS